MCTEADMHTQGEDHVKIGVMRPQATEPPEAKKEARTFPRAFRGSRAPPIP